MWTLDRLDRLIVGAVIVFGLSVLTNAQAPARGSVAGRAAAPASATRVESNLAQLMRGIVYPSSNVVFAAQGDMNEFKPAADPVDVAEPAARRCYFAGLKPFAAAHFGSSSLRFALTKATLAGEAKIFGA